MTQKERNALRDKRELTTRALKNAISKNDLKTISEWIELADKYNCSRPLRLRGWQLSAEYYAAQISQVDAIVAFNSARQCGLDNKKSLSGLFDALSAFFTAYQQQFTKHDLELMLDQIQRLTEFYKIRKLWDSPPIRNGRKITREIEKQIILAPEKIEGPATHKVERVVDALTQNVTKEEVMADFARIIAPVFREIIAKEESEEKESKSKKRKKKHGKDKNGTTDQK